jgi:Protein of unknown function (DUF1569)
MKTLAGDQERQAIKWRIDTLSPEDRGLWGKMSVGQMVCHLTDSYRLALGEKQALLASGPVQRTLLKWIALRAPLEWRKSFPTRPEVAQGIGGTPPSEFYRDRAALLGVIDRFCASASLSIPHPIFGALTEWEWMRWGWLHADHHLRQFGR